MTETVMLSDDQKRRALEFALHSRTFHRSEQLKAFLRYVVEAEIGGRGGDLTECLIGVEVLGRPTDYSPAEDSSVRTRAYELRQKLEKLYTLEAPDAGIHIVLPKGSYTPHYLWHGDPPAALPPVSHSPPKRSLPLVGILTAVSILAIGAAVYFAMAGRATSAPDPIVKEAWAPFATPDSNVALSVATPLHLTVGPATHEAFGTPSYPAPQEVYPAFRQHRPLAPDAKLSLLITDNVLGVGTMNAVVAAVNTLRSFGSAYEILPERIAPLSALRKRNMILFGAPVDSKAITDLLETAPLTVDYSEQHREFVIRDRQTGQSLLPRKDAQGEFLDVYGLVTVLNNRDSERGRLGAVVFSGITSTGTHGAAEYFSSPRALRDLRSRLGQGNFPDSYQVVVRCTFNNKLLLTYDYHSHRLIRP